MASNHAPDDDDNVTELGDAQWTVSNRRLVYDAPPWLRVDLGTRLPHDLPAVPVPAVW
jgi:hypothetical protein